MSRWMRRGIAVSSLVGLAIVAAGCSWFTSPAAAPPVTGTGTSTLVVRVRWRESSLAAVPRQNRLLALLSPPVLAASTGSAAIGVRVIYPETGETYTRSTSWNGVDEESAIVIRVLPTNLAYVFAVGVAEGQAKWYRIPAPLQIPEGGTVTINLVETAPVPATWRCADAICDQATMAGSIEGTGDQVTFEIDVADPFQIGQMPTWGDLLVRVSGNAWRYENPNGMRRFKVYCYRKDGSRCSFQPYVAGDKFGMTNADYIPVPPIVDDFTVYWQQ